jgi:hypothetical protein
MDELKVCSYLHRLKTLQKMCISSSPGDPTALLIIPGIDGRNNRESVILLKYLFYGAIGRELLGNSMVDDALEEMVLLIQESSVSVIYTSMSKKICGEILSASPFLIEYMPLQEEEDEIDLQQARKVYDFKRMILESIPAGSVIGMSIPIGYDTVQDVESWPLLQSFALDSVLCPIGFFTARYNIADLSEYLNIAYRAVDEYCVDNSISILRKSVLSHVNQTIALLDGPTGPTRSIVTSGDAVGPLEMLYEFGELKCLNPHENSGIAPLDQAHRPVLLFGSETNSIGASGGLYPKGWQKTTADCHVHTVLEGCEPSTGIRFCRTYFLKNGNSLPLLKDTEALVGLDIENEDGEVEGKQKEGIFSFMILLFIIQIII